MFVLKELSYTVQLYLIKNNVYLLQEMIWKLVRNVDLLKS